jgi:hypothetical protein
LMKIQLTNDCHEVKDMFGKGPVAGYRDLGASRLPVYALGKDAPGDRLRDDDVRGDRRWKITCEAPGALRFEKTPLTTTIAGDFDKERCIVRGRDFSIGMWQPAKKRVQNGMVEQWSHDARTIGGEANLFLMVPALGEFAGVIEPDE